jgi:thiamine kinase-like enzyme
MPDATAIADAMTTVRALHGYDGPVDRLGGLTNRVYRLGDVCLRIAGDGTAAYINRDAEAVMARAAADAGVGPAVLHADPATGLMATRFVAGATTMTPGAFRTRRGATARAAQALRRLHASGAQFPARFDLFAMIDDYLRILAPRDVALPQGYHAVLAETDAIRQALASVAVPQVPCHCDPLCENFLDTGTRMWIVDWEYAGMNDPMWDLGDLSVEAGFDDAQDTELLTAYFGTAPHPRDHGRMVAFKAMCDLLWTLWGLIQLADGNPADDFRRYADTRFARCKAQMARADFPRHLAAITSG